MRALIGVPLLAVSLTACSSLPATERTPFLPPGVFGTYQDNDVGAINFSAWAFASPTNTRGNPVNAARAIVALEYLPGELSENPRWVRIDPAVSMHMADAGEQVRQILGVRPGTPRQAVVNTLLAFAMDLQTGNQPAAMAVLASPVFTQTPAQTWQILSNLPYVQEANLATTRAQDQSFGGSQAALDRAAPAVVSGGSGPDLG
jgi:hypothetical protein